VAKRQDKYAVLPAIKTWKMIPFFVVSCESYPGFSDHSAVPFNISSQIYNLQRKSICLRR